MQMHGDEGWIGKEAVAVVWREDGWTSRHTAATKPQSGAPLFARDPPAAGSPLGQGACPGISFEKCLKRGLSDRDRSLSCHVNQTHPFHQRRTFSADLEEHDLLTDMFCIEIQTMVASAPDAIHKNADSCTI
jgi:hypothetical protein